MAQELKAGLFHEVRIGGLTLPNRIVVSPMAQYSAVMGCPQSWHVQQWGSLVASGPGLVIIEATSTEACGYGSDACLALHTDEHEAGMRRVVDQVRSISGTRLGIQLGHSGRKASVALPADGGRPLKPENGGWQTCAPSAIAFGEGWPVPQALDAEGVSRVREGFIQAAVRALRLGFDLLEIHAAHGYLLHSFLSPISNHRNDEYGGSFDARLRLVREIVGGIRQIWPHSKGLGVRLNSSDWVDGGLTSDDTVAIAAALKEAGCDFVSVSAGAISEKAIISASPGYLAPFAEQIRRRADIPTMVTGMIYDPILANEIIETGKADAVAIARAFIDDPRWAWRAAERLGVTIDYPMQYVRAHPTKWSGANKLRSGAASR
jgi:NADPH2 dehydrogenase